MYNRYFDFLCWKYQINSVKRQSLIQPSHGFQGKWFPVLFSLSLIYFNNYNIGHLCSIYKVMKRGIITPITSLIHVLSTMEVNARRYIYRQKNYYIHLHTSTLIQLLYYNGDSKCSRSPHCGTMQLKSRHVVCPHLWNKISCFTRNKPLWQLGSTRAEIIKRFVVAYRVRHRNIKREHLSIIDRNQKARLELLVEKIKHNGCYMLQ